MLSCGTLHSGFGKHGVEACVGLEIASMIYILRHRRLTCWLCIVHGTQRKESSHDPCSVLKVYLLYDRM